MPSALLISLFLVQSATERLVIQRGATGAVRDCYVWEEAPTYNGNSSTLYVGLYGATDKRAFLWFDLSVVPAGAVVSDARLVLESIGVSGQEIRVHEVDAPWAETEPTWPTFAQRHLPEVVARWTPVDGRNFVDLTALTRAWVAGRPNNGLELLQDTLTPNSTFRSSDSTPATLRPALELLYEVPRPLVTDTAPRLEAACGVPLTWPLAALAPRATTWTLAEGAPEGLTLDADGTLSWTAESQARGEHTLSVTASDGTRTETTEVVIEVSCQGPYKVGFGCSTSPLALLPLVALWWRRQRARV